MIFDLEVYRKYEDEREELIETHSGTNIQWTGRDECHGFMPAVARTDNLEVAILLTFFDDSITILDDHIRIEGIIAKDLDGTREPPPDYGFWILRRP